MNREDWLIQIINAALKGGKEILDVYTSDFAIETKDDKSALIINFSLAVFQEHFPKSV